MRLWFLALGGAGLLAAAPAEAADDTPLYRVCVESVEQHTAHRWEWSTSWPFFSLYTTETRTAVVRPLQVYSPSWMWEREVLNPSATLPGHLAIASTSPRLIAGAVLYIDAEALHPRASDELLVVEPDAVRANVRRIQGAHYEVELCPELRAAVASR